MNNDCNTIYMYIGEIGGLLQSSTVSKKVVCKPIINRKLFLLNYENNEYQCTRIPCISNKNLNQYVCLNESPYVVMITKCNTSTDTINNSSSQLYLEFRCISNSKILNTFSCVFCIESDANEVYKSSSFSPNPNIVDIQEVEVYTSGIRCKVVLICIEIPFQCTGGSITNTNSNNNTISATGNTGNSSGVSNPSTGTNPKNTQSVSRRRWFSVNMSKLESIQVESLGMEMCNVFLMSGSIEECLGVNDHDCTSSNSNSSSRCNSAVPRVNKSCLAVHESHMGFGSLFPLSFPVAQSGDTGAGTGGDTGSGIPTEVQMQIVDSNSNIDSKSDSNADSTRYVTGTHMMAVCYSSYPRPTGDAVAFGTTCLNGVWSLVQYIDGVCIRERDISFCNPHRTPTPTPNASPNLNVAQNYIIKMLVL